MADRADYMREYRARRKEGVIVIGETAKNEPELAKPRRKPGNMAQKPSETVETPQVTLEHRLKRQQAVTSRWINPFNDGLDDTGYLIGRMSQHARDRILDRLNVTKR